MTTLVVGAHVDQADPVAEAKARNAPWCSSSWATRRATAARKSPTPAARRHCRTTRWPWDVDLYVHAPYLINVATTRHRIRIPSRKPLQQHAEFCITVGRCPLRRVPATGPRTVLVLEGTVEVIAKDQRLTVTRGQSVFVAHTDGPIDVQGDGRVAIGAVPA